MFGFDILTCIVFLPLVGAAFILALRGDDEATLRNNARWAALGTTIIVFLLSLYAYAKFDPTSRPPFSSSRNKPGSAPASSTSSASTGCPCPSSC